MPRRYRAEASRRPAHPPRRLDTLSRTSDSRAADARAPAEPRLRVERRSRAPRGAAVRASPRARTGHRSGRARDRRSDSKTDRNALEGNASMKYWLLAIASLVLAIFVGM